MEHTSSFGTEGVSDAKLLRITAGYAVPQDSFVVRIAKEVDGVTPLFPLLLWRFRAI